MKMFGICPPVLAYSIFESRIDLKALVRLDSAYCNYIGRLAFTSLLSSKNFIFRNPVIFNDKLIIWLFNRQVKVSSVTFGANYTASVLAAYFRKWGSFLNSVDIGPYEMHEMFLVAIHCRNLRIVRCKNFTFDPVIKELLWCNRNILEIWFENMRSSCTIHFEDITFSKLHTLSICNSACTKAFPLLATGAITTLQKLQLGTSVDNSVLLNVVRLSPELKSLSLKDVQLSNETLVEVCATRPTLLHLDVSGNRSVNSDGMLSVLQNLTLLRSICLHRCTAISDRTINNLAILCGNTLEVVYMDVNNCEDARTVERLSTFSYRCLNLHFLSLHCYKKTLCLAGGTFELLRGLPALCTLVIDTEKVICVTSRRFLEMSRPELNIVVQNAEKHTYNALGMQI